jgi:hypothetical protein
VQSLRPEGFVSNSEEGAAVALERFPEERLLGDCLGPRVERRQLQFFERFRPPGRNETHRMRMSRLSRFESSGFVSQGFDKLAYAVAGQRVIAHAENVSQLSHTTIPPNDTQALVAALKTLGVTETGIT